MKKIHNIIFLAIALGFVGCSKEQAKDTQVTSRFITVVASTDNATKTTLSEEYKVLWSEGDEILIGDKVFTLTAGAGTTQGTFTGEAPEDGTDIPVVYPATWDGTTDNWPVQKYSADGDISGAPMAAIVNVTEGEISEISFENVGGILCYTIKGAETLASINVKAVDALDATINVALDCGADGVELTSTGVVFNIAVPAGTYSNAELIFNATDRKAAKLTAETFVVKKNYVQVKSNITPSFTINAVQLWDNGPLWALTNVGAANETDYGHYFFWGDVTGYIPKSIQLDNNCTWVLASDNTTVLSGGFTAGNFNGTPGKTYANNNENIPALPTCDAARAYLGGTWRMPTETELNNLVDKTDKEYITIGDVNGWKFINKNHSSEYIFIPANGGGKAATVWNYNATARYWSSTFTLNASSQQRAWTLYATSSSTSVSEGTPSQGRGIRAVMD